MSQSDGGGTWPEQDAVDMWVIKYNVGVSNRQTLELKEAVTKWRVTIQTELEDYKKRQGEAWDKLDKLTYSFNSRKQMEKIREGAIK